jgi:hypothetical protein
MSWSSSDGSLTISDFLCYAYHTGDPEAMAGTGINMNNPA